MHPTPTKEHEWLLQLVGEWTFESEAMMGPDQPTCKYDGKDRVRTLGGLWVLCEGEGSMPGGGTSQMIMTLGFDPAKNRFVGTFIASMMTYLWLYDGNLAGNVLTLDSPGPSFTEPGKIVQYQDIIEIKDRDHRTLTSQALGDDGKWTRFMTAHYRRVK